MMWQKVCNFATPVLEDFTMTEGRVRVRHQQLRDLLVDSGLTPQEAIQTTGLDRRTFDDLLTGRKAVRYQTLADFVRKLGGKDKNIYRYVHSDDLPGRAISPVTDESSTTKRRIHEWVETETLTDWLKTTNDLRYQILRMQHRDHEGRLGRGKCYDLRWMPTTDREEKRVCLLRHPEICTRVSKSPYFPENEKVTSIDEGRIWWVIDRWVDGPTLQERLQDGPLPPEVLSRIMKSVAEGLAVLHETGIVRRELSPRNIALTPGPPHVLLTDFELGKLLDASPTVRPSEDDWGADQYRAPEVETGDVDERADLFSWAQILVHAAIGSSAESDADTVPLDELPVPPRVRTIVARCLERNRDRRPTDMTEVMTSLTRWK
jgi:serine/threonine protein kinase